MPAQKLETKGDLEQITYEITQELDLIGPACIY